MQQQDIVGIGPPERLTAHPWPHKGGERVSGEGARRLLPHQEGELREAKGGGEGKGSKNPPKFYWEAREGNGERGEATVEQ